MIENSKYDIIGLGEEKLLNISNDNNNKINQSHLIELSKKKISKIPLFTEKIQLKTIVNLQKISHKV